MKPINIMDLKFIREEVTDFVVELREDSFEVFEPIYEFFRAQANEIYDEERYE